MWLGSLAEFRFRNSPCQLDGISRVDAEEDDLDFRLLDSAVYPFESIMFFLRSERSFHCSGTYSCKSTKSKSRNTGRKAPKGAINDIGYILCLKTCHF